MKLISVFYDWQVWRDKDGRLVLYSEESSTSKYLDETLDEGTFEHHTGENESYTVVLGEHSASRMWMQAVTKAEELLREESEVE